MTRPHRTQSTAKRLGEGSERTELARLESLYATGRYAEAATLAESLLVLSGSPFFEARIRLHLAMTHLQQGRPGLARGPLAEATRRFEAIDDPEMSVGCMAAAASLACNEQRPDAVALSTSALLACRSLKEVPTALELQILTSLACAQLLVGQKGDAIATFEEAIARADPVVDMRRLGRLLGNVGVAYREVGQLDKAITCSKRALALFETLQDLVSLAREENNLGYYLIARGDLGAARAHLERSLELFDRTNLRAGRSFVLLSLCELCLAEGNPDLAMLQAEAAIQAGESENEAWSIADARMWKARVATRLGDDDVVDDELQRALAVLESAGMTDHLVECHALYAELLERRGDVPRAYTHLKAAFHLMARRTQSV